MGNSNTTSTPSSYQEPAQYPPQLNQTPAAVPVREIEQQPHTDHFNTPRDALTLSPEVDHNPCFQNQLTTAESTDNDSYAIEEQLRSLSEQHAAVHAECRTKNEEMEELERVQSLEAEAEDARHEAARTSYLHNFELRRAQQNAELIAAYAEDLTTQKDFRKYVLFQEREDMTIEGLNSAAIEYINAEWIDYEQSRRHEHTIAVQKAKATAEAAYDEVYRQTIRPYFQELLALEQQLEKNKKRRNRSIFEWIADTITESDQSFHHTNDSLDDDIVQLASTTTETAQPPRKKVTIRR